MKMDHLTCNNDDFIFNFPPLLRKNIDELFFHGKLGLIPFTTNDVTPLTRQYRDDNAVYSYQFTLKIPYAGNRLSWELIFNPEDVTFAPDFNFNDECFLSNPDIDVIMNHVPSLVNWDVKNPKSLTSVLQELLDLYKTTQLMKLRRRNIYSQIMNEFDLLLGENFTLNNVELLVENNSVHFLFNIEIDTSALPDYLQPTSENNCFGLLNPGKDMSALKVSFMKLDGSKVNTHLQLSPRLEQVLGTTKNLYIPSYDKQTQLMEYVHLVSKLLQDLVHKLELHHQLKREYINCLCTIRGKSMLECDGETFTKAAFLCDVDGYYCMVLISIENNFPYEKPMVSLHSLYCVHPAKPCFEVIDNYPYSPRWTTEEMIKRLMAHLVNAITKFKTHQH